jgi:hypothetical protein
VDEVDAFDCNNPSSSSTSTPNNAKKWQPLTSISPGPVEEDHDDDPFALGDDDDDVNGGNGSSSKTEDLRKEDTERLKNAARASISAGSSEKPTLSESEQSGTKNKDAEELLSGGKKE